MFLEPSEKPKVIYTIIHRNLANPVKVYSGIIELQHLIDPRQKALLKERHAEKRKAPLLKCCNQSWTKNGGLILWNAIAISEMFKTSWLMVKNTF